MGRQLRRGRQVAAMLGPVCISHACMHCVLLHAAPPHRHNPLPAPYAPDPSELMSGAPA